MKQKFDLEFVMHASPSLLFNYIATPDGLAEWFADKVLVKEDVYTFSWGDEVRSARVIRSKNDSFIRYQWIEDKDAKTYFEFTLMVDELTKDLSLLVTDFVSEDEVEESKMLWEHQIEDLKQLLGH